MTDKFEQGEADGGTDDQERFQGDSLDRINAGASYLRKVLRLRGKDAALSVVAEEAVISVSGQETQSTETHDLPPLLPSTGGVTGTAPAPDSPFLRPQ